MGLSFPIAAGPRQRSYFQVQVPRDSWPHFTVSDLKLPQPGGTGLRIYIPQELGSLFFALYDSQGYGGGIRPRLHTEVAPVLFFITPRHEPRWQHCSFLITVFCYGGKVFTEPLPRNGSGRITHLTVVAQQRIWRLQY
jgi:hypothetical protein